MEAQALSLVFYILSGMFLMIYLWKAALISRTKEKFKRKQLMRENFDRVRILGVFVWDFFRNLVRERGQSHPLAEISHLITLGNCMMNACLHQMCQNQGLIVASG